MVHFEHLYDEIIEIKIQKCKIWDADKVYFQWIFKSSLHIKYNQRYGQKHSSCAPCRWIYRWSELHLANDGKSTTTVPTLPYFGPSLADYLESMSWNISCDHLTLPAQKRSIRFHNIYHSGKMMAMSCGQVIWKSTETGAGASDTGVTAVIP